MTCISVSEMQARRDRGPSVEGQGYAIDEQFQVGPHDDVGVQFDSREWTLALHEEVVKRLKGHASLGLRPLIDGSQNPARLEERQQLGKQIGSNDRDATFRVYFFESLHDCYGVCRAHV